MRRVELVAALSLAVDVGMGQAIEQGLRASLVATRLARAAGLTEDDVATAHSVALLQHVGCTAESDETAAFLGDEIAFRSDAMTVDWGDQGATFRYMLRHVGTGEPAWKRAMRMANLLVRGKEFLAGIDAVCEVAQILSRRMGFPERVQSALWHTFESWDGKGMPGRASGDAIDVGARAARVGEWAEGWWHAGGVKAAVEATVRVRGRTLDPALADCFCDNANDVLEGLDGDGVWDAVVAAEPGEPASMDDDALDEALRAIADFADQKSRWTFGHSPAVAELAAAAASELRLPAADVVAVRRAGLVHNLGRVGVPNAVWGRAGPLSRDDWERVRLHAYHTERALSRPEALAARGSDRGSSPRTHGRHGLPQGSRGILDPGHRPGPGRGRRLRAVGEDRPHRPGRPPDEAAAVVRSEVKAGRLDGDAAEAVLATAGHARHRRHAPRPGDLTDREVDVLRAISRGESIRQAAARLGIAPKTVDAHIQRIYTKIGVSTRAGATLFALQHDLLGPATSGDLPMAGAG